MLRFHDLMDSGTAFQYIAHMRDQIKNVMLPAAHFYVTPFNSKLSATSPSLSDWSAEASASAYATRRTSRPPGEEELEGDYSGYAGLTLPSPELRQRNSSAEGNLVDDETALLPQHREEGLEEDDDGLDQTLTQRRRTDGYTPLDNYDPLNPDWVQPEEPANAEDVTDLLESWRPDTLVSILLSRGSLSLTKNQYDLIRTTFGIEHLATYDRLLENIRPFMEKYALPRTVEHEIPPSWRTEYQIKDSNDDTLLIVPPSEWACHDMRDPSMFESIFGTFAPPAGESIESSGMVTHRARFTRPTLFIYSSFLGRTTRSYPDDHISILRRGSSSRCKFIIKDIWVVGRTDDLAYYNTNGAGDNALLGFKKSKYTVHNVPAGFPVAGDVCVQLLPGEAQVSSTNTYILTFRQWRTAGRWNHTTFSTFLPTNAPPGQPQLQFWRMENVKDIAQVKRVNPAHNEPSNLNPNRGVLQDNSPYFVYRYLLYADGFTPQQTKSTKGEVCGIYMLPVGIPSAKKNFTRNVHCISATPRGVSSNTVLHAIVPDIVRGCTEGFKTRTPYGAQVTVFLDCMGFVGDYPAVVQVIDTLKPKSNVPCTHCTFHVNINPDRNEGSKHAATSKVHSQMTSVVRTRSRTTEIRRHALTADDFKAMGLIDDARFGDVRCPLIYLDRKLNWSERWIKKSLQGTPVVPGKFCAYQSTAVGPDHCFFGLMKNTIVACTERFSALIKIEVDARLRCELAANGLPTQGKVFNHKGGKEFNLHSNTISSTYAIFLVGLPVFEVMFKRYFDETQETNPLLRMYYLLHRLVAETYYWPQQRVDPPSVYNRILGIDKSSYHETLRDFATAYVSSVDAVITRGLDRIVNPHVDKPNVHRHVRHVQELVFEHAHQPLKKIYGNHNARNRHYSMLREILHDDFLVRVFDSYMKYSSTEGQEKVRYSRHLCDLLFGRSINELQHSTQELQIRAKIASIFGDGPAVRALKRKARDKQDNSNFPTWKVRVMLPLRTSANFTEARLDYFLTLAKRVDASASNIPRFYRYATRGKAATQRLQGNVACQVLLTPGERAASVLRPSGEGDYLYYFTVHSIFAIDSQPYAVTPKSWN